MAVWASWCQDGQCYGDVWEGCTMEEVYMSWALEDGWERKGAPAWGKQEKREGTGVCGVGPPAGSGLLWLEQASTTGCVRGEGRHKREPDDKALWCPCHSHLVSLMETRVGKRKAESGGIPPFICLKTLPTPVSRVTIGGCQFFLSEKAMTTHSSTLAWKIPWSIVSFKAKFSLLAFYLDDLSIDVSRVLKPPAIILFYQFI